MAERIGFILDGVELERARRWLRSHRRRHRQPPRDQREAASGAAITYSFTPTGIGVAVVLQCACGAECDVTDYDSW